MLLGVGTRKFFCFVLVAWGSIKLATVREMKLLVLSVSMKRAYDGVKGISRHTFRSIYVLSTSTRIALEVLISSVYYSSGKVGVVPRPHLRIRKGV